ncbi:serine hydrolase [Streptomyces sp. SRF1]|uniref:serine hydrolase domain-containing protein n=1 Tax=Streptomyces sp. SRF1 TaxID=1549642 RepID=UPI0025B08062|nr:serine hydrolase [Streptomyces sp. SRF1]MDN3060347.1 serine hydrolase [Streptomyces sp. SRF1]
MCRSVDLPQFGNAHARKITWRHLLDQSSQWEGELWSKPTWADAQSTREGTESAGGPPGAGWACNDVRVNLTALAVTVLLRWPLPEALRERIMEPIGASSGWSWHGYADSAVEIDGRRIAVVSGGAHWGGGLWINALDLARIGQLCLRNGQWGGRRLLSAAWIEEMWRPCPGQAQLRALLVVERPPNGVAQGPVHRALRPRKWRQPPAMGRPGTGPGGELALGSGGRVASR